MPANPETATPTTARSGRAMAPVTVGRRDSYGHEICGTAPDGTCNCWPSGRGVVWSEVMK